MGAHYDCLSAYTWYPNFVCFHNLTPQLVYVEPNALDYPFGKKLKEMFEKMRIESHFTTTHNKISDFPGDTKAELKKANRGMDEVD